jgi:hypothetical protein
LSPEQERWAEALAVERRYGAEAPRHVAERIGELALAGDVAGIARWKAIAIKLDALRQAPAPPTDRPEASRPVFS